MNTQLYNELHALCVSREVRGTNAFNSYMIDKFDSEKFAELIVRQCAGIAHGSDHPSRDIKEYFGVEE